MIDMRTGMNKNQKFSPIHLKSNRIVTNPSLAYCHQVIKPDSSGYGAPCTIGTSRAEKP